MSRLLVLLSAYNGRQHIEGQIRSIMDQVSSHEIDLRIRDDGSTDDTCDIIDRLIKEYPGRIELVKGDNIGFNASYFKLLYTAKGYDYYAISDQDDVFSPEKYEIAINILDSEDTSIPLLFSSVSYLVGDDMEPYGETRKKNKEFTLYNTIVQNICPGHNQVFNNALLDLLKKTEDPARIYVYDMWITNTAMLYGKIVFLNKPLTYYRQHSDNMMGTKSSNLGKLLVSFSRLMSGDGGKTRDQIMYFMEVNEGELKRKGYYDELNSFISSTTCKKRIVYGIRSRLYRQTAIETICLRLSICVGLY